MAFVIFSEDESEHRLALNGHKYYSTLHDIDRLIRVQNKHGNGSVKELDALKDEILAQVNDVLIGYPAE